MPQSVIEIRQTETQTDADFTDEVNVRSHVTLQLLRVRASLEFQEIVFETDAFAVCNDDLHTEGCQNTDLTHEIQVHAKGDDAVEGEFQCQKPDGKEIIIGQ